MRVVAAVSILLITAVAAAGQSETPAPPPRPAAKAAVQKRVPAPVQTQRVPAAPKAVRDAALPLAERIAIQLDLAWTGDYKGLIDGEFNDKAIAAIKAFQRGRKFKETGTLNPQERSQLAAGAKSRQAQVGWVMLDDPVTGARLGIPTRQVSAHDRRQQRNPVVHGAGSDPGRNFPHPGAGDDIGGGIRAAQEAAADAAARAQCAAA